MPYQGLILFTELSCLQYVEYLEFLKDVIYAEVLDDALDFVDANMVGDVVKCLLRLFQDDFLIQFRGVLLFPLCHDDTVIFAFIMHQ